MKNKKGDEKMEHKDIWLVIGLTVILAVAVTLSTASLSGNAIKKPQANSQATKVSILEKTQPLQVESVMVLGELDILGECKKTLRVGEYTLNLPDNSKCPLDKKCKSQEFTCVKTACFRDSDCDQKTRLKKCILDKNAAKNKCVNVECLTDRNCPNPTKQFCRINADSTKNVCENKLEYSALFMSSDDVGGNIASTLYNMFVTGGSWDRCYNELYFASLKANKEIDLCAFTDKNGNEIPNTPYLIPYKQYKATKDNVCIDVGGSQMCLEYKDTYTAFYTFKGYKAIPREEVAKVYNSKRSDGSYSWVIDTHVKCTAKTGEVVLPIYGEAIFNFGC